MDEEIDPVTNYRSMIIPINLKNIQKILFSKKFVYYLKTFVIDEQRGFMFGRSTTTNR